MSKLARFDISKFPIVSKELREFVVAEDMCPECGGELDTGWECNKCGFDAEPEARTIDIDKHRRDNS